LDQDQRILELLRRDPPEGVREFLEVFGPKVKGALLRKFGGKEESRIDAAINEAAFRVTRRIDSYQSSGIGLGGYFLITARNVLVNELRREAVDEQLMAPALLGQLTDGPDQPAEKRDDGFLLELLECVRQLPEQQQRIMLADLRRGSSTPAAELATALGTKASTIYVSRNKALKKLRLLLMERGRVFP